MLTNCNEKIKDFLHSLDVINLAAVIFSFVLYVLSFLGPQNEMFIPKNDSTLNFPISTELKLYENILYLYILFFPLFLLILKLLCRFLFPKKFQNFKYFTCLWISFSSTFLSLAITNYIRHFIGFPKPDTFFVCGYEPYNGKCQKKAINKLALFISYPSFESVISMTVMTNLAFILQFIFSFLSPLYLIIIFFGIYFASKNIKLFNSHPSDVSAALFIGFIVPYYFWNHSKKFILIKEEASNNYQYIYH